MLRQLDKGFADCFYHSFRRDAPQKRWNRFSHQGLEQMYRDRESDTPARHLVIPLPIDTPRPDDTVADRIAAILVRIVADIALVQDIPVELLALRGGGVGVLALAAGISLVEHSRHVQRPALAGIHRRLHGQVRGRRIQQQRAVTVVVRTELFDLLVGPRAVGERLTRAVQRALVALEVVRLEGLGLEAGRVGVVGRRVALLAVVDVALGEVGDFEGVAGGAAVVVVARIGVAAHAEGGVVVIEVGEDGPGGERGHERPVRHGEGAVVEAEERARRGVFAGRVAVGDGVLGILLVRGLAGDVFGQRVLREIVRIDGDPLGHVLAGPAREDLGEQRAVGRDDAVLVEVVVVHLELLVLDQALRAYVGQLVQVVRLVQECIALALVILQIEAEVVALRLGVLIDDRLAALQLFEEVGAEVDPRELVILEGGFVFVDGVGCGAARAAAARKVVAGDVDEKAKGVPEIGAVEVGGFVNEFCRSNKVSLDYVPPMRRFALRL